MTHFLYLIGFASLVSIVFAAQISGTIRERVLYGLKTFGQFLIVSLVLAWIFYFLPW